MKIKTKLFLPILLFGLGAQAQEGIDKLLAAGIADAKLFSEGYFTPAAKGVMYAISNGWFNTAEGKSLGDFEILIVGNASFVSDEYKSFTINEANYNFLKFQNPSKQVGQVASALGENDPEITMIIEYENDVGVTEQVEITLPQGIGSAGINMLPTAYLQVSAGILKGTEVKVRYFPKIDQEGFEVSLYGGAIQHELTSWIPGTKVFPLSIGLLVGYTQLDAAYDLKDNSIVKGENQRVETQVSSLVFSAVVSTKLPVINFYGGAGYVTGNSESSVLGTYRIQTGVLENQTVVDPYSAETDISGFKATLGTRLTAGFFTLYADYSFQEFNNVSVGLGVVF